MAEEYFDIIIVGGGPAGCSTALHLLQRSPTWAERIVILEKERFPREKLCAGAVTRYGEAILSDLGLSIAVPTIDVRELRVQFENFTVAIQHNPVFRVTRRAEFDHWLYNTTRKRGVDIRENEKVREIEFANDEVIVSTQNSVFRARVVVGADGSKGIVRRYVGGQRKSRTARLLEVVTPEDPSKVPEFGEKFATFDFTALNEDLQGYYWDFPSLIQNEAHMNRGVFDARIRKERQRAALKDVLRTEMFVRDRSLDNVDLNGHPLHWFRLRGPFSRPNALLVGDAAGADPLLAEGISFALAYGKVAAAGIESAFKAGDFRFRSYRQRLLRDRLGLTLLARRSAADMLYRRLGRRLWRIFFRTLPFGVRILTPAIRGYRLEIRYSNSNERTRNASNARLIL